jgi:hypothetical protein
MHPAGLERPPQWQVVFERDLAGLLLILSAIAHPHLLRRAAGLGAICCFFHAIAHRLLAHAMLLKLSARLVAVDAG